MGKVKKSGLRDKALFFAGACNFQRRHSLTVARLALNLFDQLAPLHGLGQKERELLEAAAILHDIGWIKGQKKHHKVSQDIIMHSQKLKLARQERLMVGLIARYHRKSLPKGSHDYIGELDSGSKSTMMKLASFLRFADGLDRSHRSSAGELSCAALPRSIIVRVGSGNVLDEDLKVGREKADLLEKVFKRQVRILTRATPPRMIASSPS